MDVCLPGTDPPSDLRRFSAYILTKITDTSSAELKIEGDENLDVVDGRPLSEFLPLGLSNNCAKGAWRLPVLPVSVPATQLIIFLTIVQTSNQSSYL